MCEEYDIIADANEISLPYIAYVYGKSKTHFLRITGCLWALEIAFKVLALLDPIPKEKEQFVDSVLVKLAEIQDSTIIQIEVVRKAAIIMDYFITHKLIMSDLEREENSTEFKFISKAALNKSKLTSNSVASTSTSALKKNITLELRILLMAGVIVFLSPLSKTKHATSESFGVSCKLLQGKGLGEFGNFLPSLTSTRSAKGFKKSAIPAHGSDEVILFTNALLDFGCSLSEFEATLSQENVLPPPTPIVSRTPGSGTKRLSKDTSLNDITNQSKITKLPEDSGSSENE